MTHSISLQKAIEMTTRYRLEKENILVDAEKGKNILPICESFDVAIFKEVVSQPECMGLRIYYGMDIDKRIHAIVVGVNEKDEDMLPPVQIQSLNDGNLIIEEAGRCPTNCPPPSVLNP